MQVQASNPLEEDKVSICTILRQAVSVEISLSNPLDDELQFQVSLQVIIMIEMRVCKFWPAPN